MEMVIFHASFRFGKTRGRSFQSNVVLIEMEHKTCNFSVQPILGVATGMTYWDHFGGKDFLKKSWEEIGNSELVGIKKNLSPKDCNLSPLFTKNAVFLSDQILSICLTFDHLKAISAKLKHDQPSMSQAPGQHSSGDAFAAAEVAQLRRQDL